MTRKLFFKTVILSVFISVLVGCDKNDVTTPKENSSDIVGEWLMEALTYTGTSTLSVLGEEYITDFVGKSIDSDLVVDYRENNDIYTEGSYNIELSSTFLGVTTTQSTGGLIKDGLAGTWEIKGDSLITTTTLGETSSSYIEILTENTLKLVATDQRTETIEGYKTAIYTKYVIEYTKK
ncbi:MAG: hypothetical protein COB81_00505 [Flavobacteriaceae bacterium]|nr:MAG: hypothetical protein COB81_00505 [Flavobacteriaceae bacterium]